MTETKGTVTEIRPKSWKEKLLEEPGGCPSCARHNNSWDCKWACWVRGKCEGWEKGWYPID
jgi:hypothetical protein